MRKDMHAFLAIWSDITDDWANEWYRWHTEEHMPERVAIPGFLAGRRYERIDSGPGQDIPPDRRPQHCYMMYEGEAVTAFNSDAYIERLNNPTPWTRKVAPGFANFARGACQLKFSAGDGYGGLLLLLRFEEAPAPGPTTFPPQPSKASTISSRRCPAYRVSPPPISASAAPKSPTSRPTKRRRARQPVKPVSKAYS